MTEYFSLLLFLNILSFCIMESCNMKEFYQKLCEIGCCKMCALRFLGETERRAFSDPLKTLFAKGFEEPTTNNVHKIQKNNTCIACLGMLEQTVIDNTVKKVSEEISKGDYDSDTFIIALTLPVSFQIRAHAMWLYLNAAYPQICQQIFRLGVVTVGVKDVWKWIVTPLIELCISKRYDLNSDFVVTITFDYSDDNSEASLLTSMGYKPPGGRRPKNQKFDFYTRKGVDTFLNTVSTNLFTEHFGTPPKIPTEPVNCSSVSLQHNSIYFAGRYNKLSRHLPQTPWIIDGKRRIEGSIQELISDPLISLCQAETPKFAASGREDVDVRTLGSGRPFAIEFLNPHRTKFSFDDFRNVEVKINTVAHGQIAIRDLQVVDKECLDKLKQGEEHKKKAYCAYCVVFGPLPDDLDKLSSLTPLTLSQKTPIRVLHRRPFAIRPRTIHTMKAVPHLNSTEPNGPSFFKLYVTTQAGTYIKEFVHGDFGRTTPNVGDLLGGVSIDILALDVEDVSLDWPPPVNYNNVKSS